jgi:hypothetical protein
MFNSPVLDVTIGLVLIFLLYSLLVTTINEGIATALALRARMLRNAIRDHMLSNASDDTRWMSIWKGVREIFNELLVIVIGQQKKPQQKIGDHFFDHPLMKNYSATRVFPLPSYIPSKNFSTIIIDLLRKDFDQKLPQIIQYKLERPDNRDSEKIVTENLSLSTDLVKVKELLDYYGRQYEVTKTPPPDSALDEETWRIFQLHLQESGYQWERFIVHLETWFDDTMKRVSGWYKRQTQFILFLLALLVAAVLNVDSIQIANRLSIDKEARAKLTALAIQSIDTYKDDPRVKKSTVKTDTSDLYSSADQQQAFIEYKRKLDSLVQQSRAEVEDADNLLAMGWKHNAAEHKSITIYEGTRKCLGFLITALAICLGAPFWFDLLNKLIRFRGTGAKEGEDISPIPKSAKAVAVAPVIINSKSGEEAVG